MMPPTPPAPPNISLLAHVVGLLIQFQTTGDDKDQDTVLTVSFLHNNVAWASFQPPDTGVHETNSLGGSQDDYSDGKTTPWIAVPYKGTILKDIIPQSTTRVHIEPNGHDTWRFNYWVRIQYSDGSVQDYHFDGHALSEKVKENTFPLK
jgi:hypothetical protein